MMQWWNLIWSECKLGMLMIVWLCLACKRKQEPTGSLGASPVLPHSPAGCFRAPWAVGEMLVFKKHLSILHLALQGLKALDKPSDNSRQWAPPHTQDLKRWFYIDVHVSLVKTWAFYYFTLFDMARKSFWFSLQFTSCFFSWDDWVLRARRSAVLSFNRASVWFWLSHLVGTKLPCPLNGETRLKALRAACTSDVPKCPGLPACWDLQSRMRVQLQCCSGKLLPLPDWLSHHCGVKSATLKNPRFGRKCSVLGSSLQSPWAHFPQLAMKK